MFANRLKKNLARLGPWARREGLEAYRVYDRDIPEFPWMVDRYGDRALVSEHVTPVGRRQSAEARAAEREVVLAATSEFLAIPRERIALKTRERHDSPAREAHGDASHEFAVGERGHRFLVNLEDYLDTGLFLDHRNARRRVAALSAGKRVLNLFCYTGSFTVYAARAGAAATVSVDLSAPYLAWAGRNLALNACEGPSHTLVRADVFEWLRHAKEDFDVIVLDPPTLSRSKKGKSFDVQDAHVELIRLCLARLRPGGTLLFSTNFRRFLLDEPKLGAASVREITRETMPEDFREENHRCWEIR